MFSEKIQFSKYFDSFLMKVPVGSDHYQHIALNLQSRSLDARSSNQKSPSLDFDFDSGNLSGVGQAHPHHFRTYTTTQMFQNICQKTTFISPTSPKNYGIAFGVYLFWMGFSPFWNIVIFLLAWTPPQKSSVYGSIITLKFVVASPDPLHYWLRSIKGGQFRLVNFASHFIRVQIFQIYFPLILYLQGTK